MKKTILLIGLTLATVVPTFAQGFFAFNYTGVGFTTGITIGSPSNPASQQPGWYLGSDYSAEAYIAAGANQAVGSLTPLAASKVVMGFTGAATSAAGGPGVDGNGLINGASTDTGLAANSTATIQVRVWYSGGGATSYDQALSAGVNTGTSALYNIALVDNSSPPKSLDDIGLAAFTASGGAVIPEPSTFALAGLGAAAMLIFRRRK